MNRNYLIGFAVIAIVLCILAFAAWSLFEIQSVPRYIPPVREARINNYLALDRWLTNRNIPVRIESSGNLSAISRAEERQIFIQASLFRWSVSAIDYLVNWVEEGGYLFLALDYSNDWYDNEPLLLLEHFGIKAERRKDALGYDSEVWAARSPHYDQRVAFEVHGDEALALKDQRGITRLVHVKRGNGMLAVSGEPVFLYFSYFADAPGICDAPNATLAWVFFVEPGSEPGSAENGWLFIRGATKVRGLIGSLFRQGNLAALLVSVFVLLVIGFWTVIPMFGLVRGDNEKPQRPLRERFLAEGRFLKRYGALDFYRNVYIREIKKRFAFREGIVSDDEIEKRLLDSELSLKVEGRDRDLLLRAFHGELIRYREFPKMIIVLKTILECI